MGKRRKRDDAEDPPRADSMSGRVDDQGLVRVVMNRDDDEPIAVMMLPWPEFASWAAKLVADAVETEDRKTRH